MIIFPTTPEFFPGKFHGQRSLVDYKSIGSQRVKHNCSTTEHACLSTFAF